jgi:hypothetical protein
MMAVAEFRPDLSQLAERRRILGRAVRDALAAQGEEFAGFALVTWDARGDAVRESGRLSGLSPLPAYPGCAVEPD